MWTYLFRRLLWMIPTLLGIIALNFAVLRLQQTSLSQLTTGGADLGTGEGRDTKSAAIPYESYLTRFARTGNHLPSLLNTYGFASKETVVAQLRASERSAGHDPVAVRKAQDWLWLGGPALAQPLADILDDDTLSDLHGPASLAYSLCVYQAPLRADLDQLSTIEIHALQAANAALPLLRIAFRNRADQGFVVEDSPEVVAEKRKGLRAFHASHLDRLGTQARAPWKTLFLRTGLVDFLSRLCTGRLHSESKQDYAFAVIARAWQVSFGLNITSVILAWTIAVLIGLRSVRMRGSLEDKVTTTGLFITFALPEFFVGSLLLYHLCTDAPGAVRLFPFRGLSSLGSEWFSTPRYLLDIAWHAALPLVVLTYNSFTALSRYLRGNLLDQLASDYVRTARAKGVNERDILHRHVLRNSLVTMITLGSGLLASLFGGFVVVESIFSIPGLGSLLLDAARQNDIPLLMASTLISVGLLLVSILIADLLYAVADPRIRSAYG